MNWLARILARAYGTSEDEQDELTRRTAEAVRDRAQERERELDGQSAHYSQAITDAYTRRGGR